MIDSSFLNYCCFTPFGVLNCYALDTKESNPDIHRDRRRKIKKENLPAGRRGYTGLSSIRPD